MNDKKPLVSVSMNARNMGQFVAESIEGVLRQRVGFPIEIVISENCSTDDTLDICRDYADRYPEIVRLFVAPVDLGLGRNFVRTWGLCRGKYVAHCDSDDVWHDPAKLQDQVAYLEEHKDVGLSYTDVFFIDEMGAEIGPEECERVRPGVTSHHSRYTDGNVFFDLLDGNFVNSSTTVFRKELLHASKPLIHGICTDYLQWLGIAVRSKFHFLRRRTTAYRIRRNPPSASHDVADSDRGDLLQHFHDVLLDFHANYIGPMNSEDRKVVFRKLMQVVLGQPSYSRKAELLRILPYYFPGTLATCEIMWSKMGRVVAGG